MALVLSTGTLGLLYFTPLYDAAMGHTAGHWLMNAHFLVSGILFAHAVAGPDPAPARPGVPTRLVYLGVAVAAHALIAQAMYGGFFVHVHAPVDRVRQGAEIMYYAGDVAELLLAAALVATWRPERRIRSTARNQTQMPAPGVPGGTRVAEEPVLQACHGEQKQPQSGQQQDGNGDHVAGPPSAVDDIPAGARAGAGDGPSPREDDATVGHKG